MDKSQASFKSLALIFVVFFMTNFLWSQVLSAPMWRSQVKQISGDRLVSDWWLSFLVHLLMALGLNYLAFAQINPVQHGSDSLKYGTLFALVVYGVFNFTNLSLFDDYNTGLALLDIFWGVMASVITLFLAGVVLL